MFSTSLLGIGLEKRFGGLGDLEVLPSMDHMQSTFLSLSRDPRVYAFL